MTADTYATEYGLLVSVNGDRLSYTSSAPISRDKERQLMQIMLGKRNGTVVLRRMDAERGFTVSPNSQND